MAKTAAQIRKENIRRARNLPLTTKKMFWKLMLEGKSLGEAQKEAGIKDSMVAAALVIMNYKTIHILKTVDEIE